MVASRTDVSQDICNTAVSFKKIHPTLVKYVQKLRVTLHACKGNAPVSVKKYAPRGVGVFVQRNQQWVWVGEFVSVINQISSRQLLVCATEALLEVLKRNAPRYVCAFKHARSRVGMGVCVSIIFTLQ